MTVATLVVRWVAGDATRVSLTLAAALGIEVRPGQPIAIPGLLLEITGREPGAAGRGGDRLEVVVADPKFDAAPTAEDQAVRTQAPASGERAHAVAADGGTGDVVSGAAAYAATAAGSLATGDDPGTAASEGSGVRSLALGWATVDLDRAAAGWPGIAWIAASRDSLVGASGLSVSLRWRARRPTGQEQRPPPRAPTPAPTRCIPPWARPPRSCSSNPTRKAASPRPSRDTAKARPRCTSRCPWLRPGPPWHASLSSAPGSRPGPGPFGAAIAVAGAPAPSPTLILVPAE